MIEHRRSGNFDTAATAWLAGRAVLALALLIGFYVFALTIVAGLLWVPYAEIRYLHRIELVGAAWGALKLAAVCLGAAGTILWALIPRRDHFEPPGPRLDSAAHPKLFAVVREIAAAAGERQPDDVYLVNDVNAWVTERGGVLGLGSRRVMGIGLPLLQALSLQEFKAVVAHEFGHYSGGDVRLGPLIYRTRAAIGRTLAGMGESVLQGPFRWYARVFLRLTHAVSRRQEFVADAVAARIAGTSAQASALRRTAAAGPAFNGFVQMELTPVLRAGFLPPIAEGFAEFCTAPGVAVKIEEIRRAAEARGSADVFDTHPSLSERLTALGDAKTDAPGNGGQAIALLENVSETTMKLLEHMWGAEAVAKLRPIEWKAVGDVVYIAGWKAVAGQFDQWLSQFTADSIPVDKKELIRLGSNLVKRTEININSEERVGRALYVLAAGLASVLVACGFRAETAPGRGVELIRGAERIDPFAIVHQLLDGATSLDEWKSTCDRFGISGVRLGHSEAARS